MNEKRFLRTTIILVCINTISAFSVILLNSHNQYYSRWSTSSPTLLLASSQPQPSKEEGERQRQQLMDITLHLVDFFTNMVDPYTHRFYYAARLLDDGKRKGGDGDGILVERQHAVHPVRDLAAAWDATKCIHVLLLQQQHDDGQKCSDEKVHILSTAVLQTLSAYSTVRVVPPSRFHVPSPILKVNAREGGESSSTNASSNTVNSHIGHSALYILATLGALRLNLFTHCRISHSTVQQEIHGLVQGILYQQRHDGAFLTYFDNDDDNMHNDDGCDPAYTGIDFYPGQALLALLEVYRWGGLLSSSSSSSLEDNNYNDGTTTTSTTITHSQILPCVASALNYYESYYRKHQPDLNYHIWQLQAFGRYYYYCVATSMEETDNDYRVCETPATGDNTQQQQLLLRRYVQDMTIDLVSSRLWSNDLSKGPSFYPNISTLPVVCGFDTLVDVMWLMNHLHNGNVNVVDADKTISSMVDGDLLVDRVIRYLVWSQGRSPTGGLGYGGWTTNNNNEQRLDVTGHAISALAKVLLGNTADAT